MSYAFNLYLLRSQKFLRRLKSFANYFFIPNDIYFLFNDEDENVMVYCISDVLPYHILHMYHLLAIKLFQLLTCR